MVDTCNRMRKTTVDYALRVPSSSDQNPAAGKNDADVGTDAQSLLCLNL